MKKIHYSLKKGKYFHYIFYTPTLLAKEFFFPVRNEKRTFIPS